MGTEAGHLIQDCLALGAARKDASSLRADAHRNDSGQGARGVAIYARVSSADQKADLDRQIARLAAYASKQGWVVTKVVLEIGSGLNGHRPKLVRLLSDPKLTTIVVEYRDRLMRFGFEYVEAALAAQGRRLWWSSLARPRMIWSRFCARLYGRRSARNKAKKALEVIEREG